MKILKQTLSEFSADKVPRLGAALAYYTIFSIAPLLLIAISVAGLVFGREAVQGQLFIQLRGVLGPTAAEAVQEMVKNASKPASGVVATVVGVVTLILGASGVFGQLKDALNTIWDVEPKKVSGVIGFLKARFLSVAMVFGIAFLLLVSLILDAAVATVGKFAQDRLPGGEALWQSVQLAFSFCVVTVLFAMIFRFLPDLKIEWRDVWLGATFTSLLFVIGKFALGLYLGKSAVGSSFGAAGSLVVLLLWVYYSAQILLFGAEFTQVYARAHGSLKDETAREEAAAKREETPAPKPVVAAPQVAWKTAPGPGGAGVAKMAGSGFAGLVLGTLVGGVAATLVVVKSVKKLIR
ncbi:MAG: rane protein [Acidobacteriota bacterium]|nr:rane protein [Acidobacteriota bacterium]